MRIHEDKSKSNYLIATDVIRMMTKVKLELLIEGETPALQTRGVSMGVIRVS